MHRPDDSLLLENQLCFPLYAAARKMTAAYAPFLKPLQLTYTQYLVLLVLWERDDISVGALCEKLRLDNGTVTPVLKRLESAGRIVRRRQQGDGRIVHVALTDEGRALEDRARAIPASLASCLGMSPEDAGRLKTLLEQFLDTASSERGGASEDTSRRERRRSPRCRESTAMG